MARLWSSGFELNSTSANVEWTNANGTPSIQTTTVRSDTYALQINSLSSGTRKGLLFTTTSTTNGASIFYRVYLNVNTLPSAANQIIVITNGTVVSTMSEVVYIALNSDGTLQLGDEDGTIGSTSSVLSTNTWYLVEIEVSPTVGNDTVKARLDGVEFASSTTRNLGVQMSGFAVGGNLNSEAQTTGNWFFDDVAINDSTGSFQNSYPGIGEEIHLRPNAAGDNWDWLPPGSSYTEIDEVTPDDGTTETSTTSNNAIIDVNITATPAALASDDTINVVQVGGRIKGSSTGTTPTGVFRIKASASGTVEESANLSWNTASYFTNSPSSPYNYQLTLYDLPGASTTAWTKSDLDTTQIGFRSTNDPTGTWTVTTLWLLVDHQPAVAGGGGTTPIGVFMTTNKFWGF